MACARSYLATFFSAQKLANNVFFGGHTITENSVQEMSMRPLTIVFCLVLSLAIISSSKIPTMSANNSDPAKVLHDLFASEWEYIMEQFPTFASLLGDRRWNDKWTNVSLEAIKNRHDRALAVLVKLKAIDRAQLSEQDKLNYDLFKKEYETDVEEYKYRWYLVPLNQRGGIQTEDELTDSLRFQTVKDFEDWIGRLRAFPAYTDQTIELMRQGAKSRIILPRIVMQRVPAQIDKQIVEKPEDSPFYKPFVKMPDSIPAADQERLAKNARDAVASSIIPSFRKFKEFFEKEYLPATFDQVGAWQLPNGQEMYAFFARRYTTSKMTPAEIHQIGLKEVARIRAEMQTIMSKVGFKGSLQDFFKFLRTDPQFYYKDPDELLDAYRAMSKRIDPHMVRLFKTLPRAPYGVEPIPEKIAPDTTTAYYQRPAADGSRAGVYYVNLFKPETRPKYEMMALSLHEAVPGHHHQIAVAMELGEIPNFRRFGGYTAFVEGWGLYAESLGDELGLYDDPYSKFGQLTYEMWRAVRLVVDTGIHHMKWDRQKAIDFFLDNAAKQENDVINEIDRYISWPGQALAYKIGELKIKELRAKATSELGDKFDVKEFHDVVLLSGAVPLDVLERNVNEWITKRKSGT